MIATKKLIRIRDHEVNITQVPVDAHPNNYFDNKQNDYPADMLGRLELVEIYLDLHNAQKLDQVCQLILKHTSIYPNSKALFEDLNQIQIEETGSIEQDLLVFESKTILGKQSNCLVSFILKRDLQEALQNDSTVELAQKLNLPISYCEIGLQNQWIATLTAIREKWLLDSEVEAHLNVESKVISKI